MARPTEKVCECGKRFRVARKGRVPEWCPACRDRRQREASARAAAARVASGQAAKDAEAKAKEAAERVDRLMAALDNLPNAKRRKE